jgi:hypothetical protein
MGLIQELFGAIEYLRMSLGSVIYIQNQKLGPVGQVRYDRLGHRSSLFMVFRRRRISPAAGQKNDRSNRKRNYLMHSAIIDGGSGLLT